MTMLITQVNDLIDVLDIDYSHFSIEYVCERVSLLTLRNIEIHYVDVGVDGAYFQETSTKTDHIICKPSGDAKKMHTVLHELGHILFGHRTYETEVFLPSDLRMHADILCRNIKHIDKKEREAETFAIQLNSRYLASRKTNLSSALDDLL